MNFTYETQGAITYLVCELETTDQLDGLSLGMLTNNHIAGLAPVLYTEMNGQRFLKYNISAKIAADKFFGGSMNKERTLLAFQNILSAVCSADDYMIDINCFSMSIEHIFLNVSNCEAALICVPVVGNKDVNAEAAASFKQIMFSTQFNNNEDAAYITQLISYINNGAAFTVYGMKDLVTKLQSGVAMPQGAAMASGMQPGFQAAPQMATQPAPQPRPAAAPASSFDSTISIDDMPAMMAQRQQAQQPQQAAPQMPPQPAYQPAPAPRPQVQPAPVQNVNIPTPPPARPVPQPQPQPQVRPQPQPQSAVPSAGRPINNGAAMPQAGGRAPQGGMRPPVNNGGFAVPGKPGGNFATPPVPNQGQHQKAQPNKGAAKAAAGAGNEKKMSLMGLLAHYNKENAALYKQQKAEAKAKKAAGKAAAAPGQRPVPPQGGGFAAPQGNAMNRPPVGGVAPAQQQFAQQQFAQPQVRPQPQVQPVPVQNSFNETTVLTSAMVGGETTVLGAGPATPNPCLVRTKTGERISINKPVFRIGKEKSYVDYFIGDNTAISRSHANIHTENGEYFVEDTNSTNHTYVNGRMINSSVKTKLTSGDKVRLANEDFTFTV